MCKNICKRVETCASVRKRTQVCVTQTYALNTRTQTRSSDTHIHAQHTPTPIHTHTSYEHSWIGHTTLNTQIDMSVRAYYTRFEGWSFESVSDEALVHLLACNCYTVTYQRIKYANACDVCACMTASRDKITTV